MNDIRVVVEQRQPVHLLGVLLALGLILAFWKYLLIATLFAASATCLYLAFRFRAQEQDRLRRAAHQQMAWDAKGDPRGLYGPDWRPEHEGLQPTVPACGSSTPGHAGAQGHPGAHV